MQRHPQDTMTGIFFRVLIILAAGFWAMSPVLRGEWLLDDLAYYPRNPLLGDPHQLWKIWFEPGTLIDYYPIEATFGWLQWSVWHQFTFGYHLVNLALHLLNALLVWRLLERLGLRLAWLGGLIFAVHPVQVESVAYLAELKNTLSLAPFLLAMEAWIDFEDYGRRLDYVLALVLFLIAMLCKISMIGFPFVILLYAWWKHGRIDRHDLKRSLPFFAVSLVLGAVAIHASHKFMQAHLLVEDSVPMGGFFSHLALAGLSLSFYFLRFVWPVGSLPVYPFWKIDPPTLLQFVPWLVWGGVIFLAWRERKTWGRVVLFGLGFFIINLAPFLGFRAISYMSFTWVMDHFLYLPIIGLIGLTVVGLDWLRARVNLSVARLGAVLVGFGVGFLVSDSHAYAKKFESPEILWSYAVSHNPQSWAAQNNLASALHLSGRVTRAIAQYEQAIQLNPNEAVLRENLGLALMDSGRRAEAIDQFQQAIALRPGRLKSHYYLGMLLAQEGKLPEAREHFEFVLHLDPAADDARHQINSLDNLERSGAKISTP